MKITQKNNWWIQKCKVHWPQCH